MTFHISEFVDEADLSDFVDGRTVSWRRACITVGEIITFHRRSHRPTDDREAGLERIRFDLNEALREEARQSGFWDDECG